MPTLLLVLVSMIGAPSSLAQTHGVARDYTAFFSMKDLVEPGLVLKDGGIQLSSTESARAESPRAHPPFLFREAVLSWNGTTPPGTGLVVEARIETRAGWCAWKTVGRWCGPPSAPCGKSLPVTPSGDRRGQVAGTDPGETAAPEDPAVKLDADTLIAPAGDGSGLQVRVTLIPSGSGVSPSLRLLGYVVSRKLAEAPPAPPAGAGSGPEVVLDVPFRSQNWEAPELARRICCPTSLAMVLEYHGVAVPTAQIAAQCYDAANDIYGNWSYAAAAGASHGLTGYVTRIRTLREVRRHLERGHPLITSLRFGPGELDGSPMASRGTKGHLVVVRGLTAEGDVYVNDPAGRTRESGRVVYRAAQFLRAWKNGVATLVSPGPDGEGTPPGEVH